MNARTVSIVSSLALAGSLLFAAPAAAQLPSPSPCCEKVCNPDGSSSRCAPLAVADTSTPLVTVVEGCLEVGPLACVGGQGVSLVGESPDGPEDIVLTQGCACLLSEGFCLNIGLPADLGPVTPEECTEAAVAACGDAGRLVVTPDDPDCVTPGEDCDNGTDDDGDGDVDCDDSDCANDPTCQPDVED